MNKTVKLFATLAIAASLVACGGGGGEDDGDGGSGAIGTGGPVVMGQNGAVDVNTAGAFAVQMLAEVNAARAVGRNCGGTAMPAAAPLTWNAILSQAATNHAADMSNRNYFSHSSPEGKMADKRAAELGYKYTALNENIGSGTSNLKEIMQAWLNSPGHCRTIMDPMFKEMGAGYVNYRFVQVFGSP